MWDLVPSSLVLGDSFCIFLLDMLSVVLEKAFLVFVTCYGDTVVFHNIVRQIRIDDKMIVSRKVRPRDNYLI